MQLAPLGKVGGVATMESTGKIGLESVAAPSTRSSFEAVTMGGDIVVEQLTIGSRDILHIGKILQSALNLERRSTGLNQSAQMLAEIQVLQRQQVALVLPFTSVGIDQVKLHPAELSALSAVGTTMETMLRGIAPTRIADAECSVDKHLKLHLRHSTMYLGNLVNRELTGQHSPAEPMLLQPAHLLRRAIVGLSRGMQGEGQAISQRQQLHVLYENGIDAGIGQVVKQTLHVTHLIRIDKRIDRGIDLRSELMCIGTELSDIGNAIAGSHPCSPLRATYIHGISAMVDSRHATCQVLGWCQQFELCHHRIWLMS